MAEQLTQRLATLNAQYQQGRAAERSRALSDLQSVAATRHQVLLNLVESDPGAVLRLAVPAGLRAGLPPGVQTLVEEDVEMEGDLEVLHEDGKSGSRYLYFLEVAGQRFSLHFAADPPRLLSGTRVRVRGVRVNAALAVESGSASVEALSAVLPNTFGQQNTAVILVTFQNNPIQPYTPEYARSVVITNPSWTGTADWDYEASYHQTWLAGDVFGWYTIAQNSSACDYNTLATLANQAAAARGVNLSYYRRLVYAFPQNACSWWGLGTVGGDPSQAWINGSLELRVVGHEMGHNFGLYHSHAWECGSSVLGTNCSNVEYGDSVDIMGSMSGHFTAFHKERLGWLGYGSSPPIETVATNGTYWVDRYESFGVTAKALKILKATDSQTGMKTWYYVEYRQAVGFDRFLSGYSNILNGVLIHTGAESSPDSSYLLDMTPETPDWSDPALGVGKSFHDPAAGVTITLVSTNGTSAAVSVSFDAAPPCVRANPTVALSPSQSQWVRPGTAVTYTISVTNRDSSACLASGFDLQVGIPSGWTATVADWTLSLDPGAGGSTTLTVTSPTSAADAFYTIDVTATNHDQWDYFTQTSATYVVASPAQGNRLANPGFELDANGDGKPDSWSTSSKFTRSNAVKHGGSYAGKFFATDNASRTIYQTVNSLSAGTTYSFSGCVNIPSTSDSFSFKFEVKWRNASGSTISTRSIKSYTASTGGVWNCVSNTGLVAPAGTVGADVRMVASSLNLTIYVDDLLFQ